METGDNNFKRKF